MLDPEGILNLHPDAAGIKEWTQACSEVSGPIETILDLIDALYLENFEIRLPVTDQTFVKIGSLLTNILIFASVRL